MDHHAILIYIFIAHKKHPSGRTSIAGQSFLTLEYVIDPNDDDDDVVAALKHPDRVHRAILIAGYDSSVVGDMLEELQVPFPVLTHLDFIGPEPKDEVYDEFFLPDEFLGGSAPRLQHLRLQEISFSALPKLLLSTRDLVFLELQRGDPRAYLGYVSPEAMVGGLAGLTKLRTLRITSDFPENPLYSDEQIENLKRRPSSIPIRALLPALNEFVFRGSSWYSEGLVAQIDAPHVKVINIDYISSEIEASQLSQFIGRTTTFKFAQFRRAHLNAYKEAYFELDRPQGECRQLLFQLTVSTLDDGFDHLVPCMTRVLRQLGAMLSDVGQLAVKDAEQEKKYYLDNNQWLPLLHLFPAVEALHVTGWVAGYIAEELQDVAEDRVTEVLPALHSLWLGSGAELAESRFLSLRQLSGRPVTVVDIQDQFDW